MCKHHFKEVKKFFLKDVTITSQKCRGGGGVVAMEDESLSVLMMDQKYFLSYLPKRVSCTICVYILSKDIFLYDHLLNRTSKLFYSYPYIIWFVIACNCVYFRVSLRKFRDKYIGYQSFIWIRLCIKRTLKDGNPVNLDFKWTIFLSWVVQPN